MHRRDFVKLGSMLAATAASASNYTTAAPLGPAIDFLNDGLLLTPAEYSSLLMRLADEGKIKADFYSNGGVVEELEHKFAKLLGKDSAVFMPTGTLANHLALRKLAGNHHRGVMQEQSHIYNDTGDSTQVLSQMNLIPLGPDSVCFSVGEMERILARTKSGRVEAQIGVMAIETPVRRQLDRMVSFDELTKLTTYAKRQGIATHLDGARLFVQSVHTDLSPEKYGALFDTVFTSMWKCFNAASGAVLAGSDAFTEKLFHERRMFGGGLPAAWVFAAVALHYADGFIKDYETAWQTARQFFSEIEKNEHFKITRFEGGSHIVHLKVQKLDNDKFRNALMKRKVEVAKASGDTFMLKVNPSLCKTNASQLAGYFLEASKESAA